MRILKWLFGIVICQMKPGYHERLLNLIRHHKIKIWDVVFNENGICFTISVRDYKRLEPLIKKSNVEMIQIKERGLPLFCKKAISHRSLLFACVVFSVLLHLYSQFIWQIVITGQNETSEESILETIQSIDVYPGMMKRKLDCRKIESFLRKKCNRISWVSAEEVGSRLIVKVKEGTKPTKLANKEEPAHLIASCDGVVTQILASTGTPAVKKGDAVHKGDILIYGYVSIFDDSKTEIKRNPVHAAGTVILESGCQQIDTFPVYYKKKIYTGKKIVTYRLEWNGHKIEVKNPLKRFDKSKGYDIIDKVCYDNSKKYFGLNIQAKERVCLEYIVKNERYTKSQVKELAKKRLTQMILAYHKENAVIIQKKGLLWKRKKDWLLKSSITIHLPQIKTRTVRANEWSVENGTNHRDSSGT